jgi:hypothetical protein
VKGRARELVLFDLWPVRIVQRPDHDPLHIREPFEGYTEGRPTAWAELERDQVAALVRLMVIRAERALDAHSFLDEESIRHERTPGDVLAEGAVANGRSNRLALNLIPNGPAQAPTLMEFGHCPLQNVPASQAMIIRLVTVGK